MHISRANIEDLEGLSTMYYQLMDKSVDTIRLVSVFKQIADNELYYLLVARNDDNIPIGTAMGILCYDLTCSCYPFMLIENVVVLEDYRGKGVAGKLIKDLERTARLHKCTYIMLVSDSNRKKSHLFYEKVGFNPENGYKMMLK